MWFGRWTENVSCSGRINLINILIGMWNGNAFEWIVLFSVRFVYLQVLDYTQYYLDLDEANADGEPVWQPEYNLTTHYFGMGEVNAMALHNLADRFSNTDNQWFAKWVLFPFTLIQSHCFGLYNIFRWLPWLGANAVVTRQPDVAARRQLFEKNMKENGTSTSLHISFVFSQRTLCRYYF